MKHSLKITLILIAFFLAAQVIGLAITGRYIKTVVTEAGLVEVKEVKSLPYNMERPVVGESASFIYIMVSILIATTLILLLMKFRKTQWWRVWFFLAVVLTLSIAFSAFMPSEMAGVLALILTYLKIYRPGLVVQNLTEVFVYAGLAAIFVPVMNLFAAFMLLLLISVYDFIAVRKTGHMIKLAKFQAKSKIFAGLVIPYEIPGFAKGRAKAIAKGRKGKVRTAILGGGDIGLPLLFAGVAMKNLGFGKALVISIFATLALSYLLLKSEKGKFYPAMPIISAGCALGYLVASLFL